jgi:transcription initiation factor IIE alpha subunit
MFYTCPHCGAHLDSMDKKCNCEEEQALDERTEEQNAIEQYYKEWYAS